MSGVRRGVAPRTATIVLGVLFAMGIALGRVGFDALADGAARAFNAIANAHYQLYLARENVNTDGAAEFAILVDTRESDALNAYIARRSGWSVRNALVPGWMIVTVPAGTPDGLAQLRQASFARAVLRNRGMWICH